MIEPPADTFDQSLALVRVASELSRQAQWARADRRRPIYGASGIGWIDLASVIRAKIAAGLLPRDLPKRLRVSRGSGKACDGSEQPITRRHRQIEFDATTRLHYECLQVWDQVWDIEWTSQTGPPRQGIQRSGGECP